MRDRIVPTGWRLVSLGDVTTERSERVGNAVRDVTVLSSTKHRGLIPSNEYFKNRVVYSDDLSSYKTVRKGWFAYATNHLTEGSIGLQKDHQNACVSPIYTVFSCLDDIDESYLYRFVKSPEAMNAYAIHDQASVDRRGAVRYRDFSKIQLALPPLQEQRRIAEIFDAIDHRISEVQKVAMKQKSAMVELVTAALSQVAYRRIPLRACVRSNVPIGYGIVQAGPHIEDGVPYIRTGDMAGDQIDSGSLLRTTPEISESYARTQVVAGDLVVTIRATVGKVLPVPPELEGVNLTRGTARVAPSEELAPGYLLWALRSRESQAQLAAAVKGTTFSEITLDQLRDLLVPVPHRRSHQEAIVRLMEASTGRSAAEQAVILKLQNLKRALMDDLLTGRVRVPVSDEL
ncbi:restriction endonuclease subunit S [Streptomyces sp. H39-S7]|uniref:restriction endonuclease subunit S n=1 Tax=Streptomyces sp. H39-S7 TaxID=3004357 RepID=UPI0022AE84B4|nr:restriction endonuclease subunit S [Streptomyces sp. H39-S7]MCZ4120801.1 restriction endonuclease subunit S [Streptomyces sp. H39-S7]